MPIVTADIKIYLSGGAGNADPNLALGGVISTTLLVDNTLHNLFDKVTGAEAAAGDTEYRAIFIKNTHATLTLEGAMVFILTNTPSADTSIQIALAVAAGTPIETVANESTAPAGPAFSLAANAGAALSIGNLAPGAMKAIWVKWIVNAAAVAVLDTATIEVFGDSNP